MNAINLFFSQPVALKQQTGRQMMTEVSSGFMQSLQQMQTELANDELPILAEETHIADPSTLLMLLLGLSDEELMANGPQSIDQEALEDLLHLHEELFSNETVVYLNDVLQQLEVQNLNPNTQPTLEGSHPLTLVRDATTVPSELARLGTQAESIIASIVTEDDVIKVSGKLLELLEKWTALDKGTSQAGHSQIPTEEDSNEIKLWRDLLQTFEKRSELAGGRQYNSEAEVTSKDVAKWVHHGITSLTAASGAEGLQQGSVQQPISKLEQYAIHINLADNTEPADKQLIKEFQNVMKTGRFTMNNGMNQFTIALRPDNLGEMMVRLTQVDGEMTLKIIVSSQATKQMLESNIKELRSMFAPHQVVIERQDAGAQSVHQEHEEQAFDDQDDDTEHFEQNQSDDNNGDFEKEFQDLLMNMRV